MRLLLILTACCAVALGPARSDGHEFREFPLRHNSASDFEETLLRSAARAADPLPRGLTGWTVDPDRNMVFAQGTPEALEGLERLIRLFDVAPTRVTFRITPIPADPAGLGALTPLDEREDGPRLLPLGEDAAALRFRQAVPLGPTWELAVVNNRPLYLRDPAGPRAALLPRVNGDRTITLMGIRPGASPTARPDGLPGSLATIRRVASGDLLLLAEPGKATWWLVRPAVRE